MVVVRPFFVAVPGVGGFAFGIEFASSDVGDDGVEFAIEES